MAPASRVSCPPGKARDRGRISGRSARSCGEELPTFSDRREAGRALATAASGLADRSPIVVGLPRGGVPVAYEVAQALDAPLDVFVARKIGLPSQPELGMGAIAEGGALVVNAGVMRSAGVGRAEFEVVEQRERIELERRAALYREGSVALDLHERTVVVVDDGLATGATARAAVDGVRRRGAREVALAVPVGARETVAAMRSQVDAVFCVESPRNLRAVGEWYRDFSPTTDEEVLTLLRLARSRGATS